MGDNMTLTLTLTLTNPNPKPLTNPNPNPKHYVILSPISDWLIYVLCVPSTIGQQCWPPGHFK